MLLLSRSHCRGNLDLHWDGHRLAPSPRGRDVQDWGHWLCSEGTAGRLGGASVCCYAQKASPSQRFLRCFAQLGASIPNRSFVFPCFCILEDFYHFGSSTKSNWALETHSTQREPCAAWLRLLSCNPAPAWYNTGRRSNRLECFGLAQGFTSCVSLLH